MFSRPVLLSDESSCARSTPIHSMENDSRGRSGISVDLSIDRTSVSVCLCEKP